MRHTIGFDAQAKGSRSSRFRRQIGFAVGKPHYRYRWPTPDPGPCMDAIGFEEVGEPTWWKSHQGEKLAEDHGE